MALICPVLIGVFLVISSPSTSALEASVAASAAASTPPPKKYPCISGSYPPPASTVAPSFTVDLDAPASQRWRHVIRPFVKPLKQLMDHLDEIIEAQILQHFGPYFPARSFFWLVGQKLPMSLMDELRGVAEAAKDVGVSLESLVSFNVLYELSTACTSIVARKPDGDLIHGRNMDFGPGLGRNLTTNQHIVTELLRALTIDVHFKRNGKILYSSTSYAGAIFILTGVKKGAFSMSLNRRVSTPRRDFQTIEVQLKATLLWALNMKEGNPVVVVTRALFEQEAESFQQAKNYLESVPLVSTMYFILGGISGQDGCVVTRTSDRNLAPMSMQSMGHSWILKTNFDHWGAAPTWDDRRRPGIYCMKQKESAMNFATLYDVLSSRPVFNIATSYTSLMEVRSGKLETYIRFCEFPCSPGNGLPVPYGGFNGL